MTTNLEQLYFDQIRDLYSAETQLASVLPDLAARATSEELKEAFTHHLAETREQIARLESICQTHGVSPGGEECNAMRGLIRETVKHAENTLPGDVRDAVLIASSNRIEHYEIAAYGVSRTFAETLGFMEDAALLSESLDEEGAADARLTRIATGSIFRAGVNEAAAL